MGKLEIFFKFALVTSIVTSLSSCNYNSSKNPVDAATPNSEKAIPGGQKIDFESVEKFSLSTCLNCHAGKKAPNLTKLAEIQQIKDKIWHEVDSRSMPPASSGYKELSGCSKELLRKWIDMGAPETSETLVSDIAECKKIDTPQDPPQPPTPPLEPTPILLMPLNYNSINERILKPKCLLCHSEKGEQSDLSFYPFETLMILDRLWSTPAKDSKIFKEITNKEDGMPPTDSKISRLTDDEIEFIRRWIDAGKPEK